MSERVTRVPAISTPTDNNLRDVARQIKALLDVREGVSGDPLDKAVTFRDIESLTQSISYLLANAQASSGSSSSSSNIPVGTGTSAYDPTSDQTIPESPEGFEATGLFASVLLSWTAPRIKNYAYTEIWRADRDQISSAVLIGTSRGTSYVDYFGGTGSKYYWARFVTQANVTGPYHSTSGTLGSSAPSPDFLLGELTGKITESQLYTDLGSRIDLIDGPADVVGSVNYRIQVSEDDTGGRISTLETTKIGYCTIGGTATDATDRASCEASGGTWNVGLPIATAVKQVSISDGAESAALEQRFTAQKATNGTLLSQYTVKVDNNGYVSGFGLASTAIGATPYSSFTIRADSFSISNPSSTNQQPITPFVVQTSQTTASNGAIIPAGVYIDGAYIKNATITKAKIGSVDADTINAGYTNSVDLESSIFYGSEFYIGGRVTYEYNYPGQPTRRTGIATVINPNIALKSTGAEFNVNYFKVTNGGDLYTPFEVVNGAVRISAAFIGDATITAAKIADTIQSTNFQDTATSRTGWKIDKSGTMVINNATFRGTIDVKGSGTGGRLEIKNNVIKVYDEYGTLRVQIGDLTA
jgi:Domain of unknown function (DUF1983)